MLRRRHTFDENSVPPWTRGDLGGLGVTHNLVWVVVGRPTRPARPLSSAATPPRRGFS